MSKRAPKDTPTMKRGEATKLIDRIREDLATEGDPAAILESIRRRMADAGIPPLVQCDGQAHSNPYIDNCGRCMPRWGLVGAPVVVR